MFIGNWSIQVPHHLKNMLGTLQEGKEDQRILMDHSETIWMFKTDREAAANQYKTDFSYF